MITIVIDPGHGGENEGTIEDLCGRVEKNMTLQTAKYLYKELSGYDDVQVFMTREEDVELPLKERADFAKSVSADFMFSVHYNASPNHDLYGSEVWIPSEEPLLDKGFDFAIPMLHAWQDEGLYIRGAKTRLNKSGSNYYGIIRESTLLDIPCVILEHCHLDNETDIGYADEDSELRHFAETDAKVIAGYFGLKKDGETPEINRNVSIDKSYAFNKSSDPDYCEIGLDKLEGDTAYIRVKAEDYDTFLLYYDYSVDGGLTYSGRIGIPGYDYFEGKYDKEFVCEAKLAPGRASGVSVRVYNLFDGMTESNTLWLTALSQKAEEEVPKEEPRLAALEEETKDEKNHGIERISFIIIGAAFLAALIATAAALRAAKRKRRRYTRTRKRDDDRRLY